MTLSPNTTHPFCPPGGTILQYETEGGGAAGVTQGNGPVRSTEGSIPARGMSSRGPKSSAALKRYRISLDVPRDRGRRAARRGSAAIMSSRLRKWGPDGDVGRKGREG